MAGRLSPEPRAYQWALPEALEVSADYLLGEEEGVSFDELLRHDQVGQAIFRSYEELTPQGREQVRSFVSWLIEEEKRRKGQS